MKKVLIFVVAYGAEGTIQSVLARLPNEVLDSNDCTSEVLIIDDCPPDQTVRAAYRSITYRNRPVTILQNPNNLGYGGNQKVGCRYGIQHGFDIVAMVHGDEQYAPEKLPELLVPLLTDKADAVFGSRMMNGRAALDGGMPFCKFAGVKILTAIENALVGTVLSGYQSGYRLYDCNTLSRLPYESNSDGFDFDTDIIIQLHRAGARILEIPVPTFYGDEICHVNGVAHGCRIVLTCLHSILHRFGILYHRKFDLETENYHYRSKAHFPSTHSEALKFVKDGEHVIDFGCGPGDLSALMCKQGAHVTGVDRHISDATRANCTLTVQADINALDWHQIEQLPAADTVLLLDIVEHLTDPDAFLQRLRRLKNMSAATIIVSVPNVAFWPVRLMLLFGQFNYGKAGILDRTHLRFFTRSSMKDLFEGCGLQVDKMVGINPTGATAFKLVNLLTLGTWSDMRYLQFAITASLAEE